MARDDVLGNRALRHFDVCIIGSGAGGGTAAYVLTHDDARQKVLVLEAGPNPFPGLDRQHLPFPLHGNDELKYAVRGYIQQDGFLEPRTFRIDDSTEAMLAGDVNSLPKAVGGAFQHADCKTPRFNAVDFRLKTAMDTLIATNPGLLVKGFNDQPANFVDWPFTYDELEPFYAEAEALYGVQGEAGGNGYEARPPGTPPLPPRPSPCS